MRRSVRLLISSELRVPMTAGFLEPAIVVPVDAIHWGASRRRAVLLHELTHVARHDWLKQVLARVVVILHWPNPLAWLAVRAHVVESELACDEAVLAAGMDPIEYSIELVGVARSAATLGRLAHPGPSMVKRSGLEHRLLALRDHVNGNRVTGPWALRLIQVIAAGFIGVVSTAAPVDVIPPGGSIAPPPTRAIPDREWTRIRATLDDGQSVALRLFGEFEISNGAVIDLAARGICVASHRDANGVAHRFELHMTRRGRASAYFRDGVRRDPPSDADSQWKRLLSVVSSARFLNGALRVGNAGVALEVLAPDPAD